MSTYKYVTIGGIMEKLTEDKNNSVIDAELEHHMSMNANSADAFIKELIDIYGPLIELGKLASLLDRNRNGIRDALVRIEKEPSLEHPEWLLFLSRNKFKIGKKTLFRTKAVACLILKGSI